MLSRLMESIGFEVTMAMTYSDQLHGRTDVDARRQRVNELLHRWLNEIKSEDITTPQQIALRLLQKSSVWTSKELAGVNLSPQHN
ncbi:hypothetical protein SH661x_001922 [Planctomicrobium sp. SH661]|uniref:hypothetical protein n=1 Tax=Planctomicrobium sp. SH661 TaxID=3448124 RepID=UPI003F5BC178